MRATLFAVPRLIACSTLLCILTAHAAVMYRWVDENGRTHVSDVVPEKYKKSATRIDSSQFEASPQRKQQAEEQAAREKAAAEKAASRPQGVEGSARASAAPPGGGSKRPARGVTDATDCETWRRLYEESMECFGPYRTATGGIKAEAYDRCTEIPSPDPKCGPVRQ